jgi:D-3-phosphoglycerate dehydrogenase/(S)-sulfolactate dehydrogenase
MKPSAIIVNVGRGEVINEADLVAALKAKTIAGAALDVRAQNHRLWVSLRLFPM